MELTKQATCTQTNYLPQSSSRSRYAASRRGEIKKKKKCQKRMKSNKTQPTSARRQTNSEIVPLKLIKVTATKTVFVVKRPINCER